MNWWSSFITQAGDWWGASQPVIALVVLLSFFMIGLIGCVLPIVPGPVIVWAGMIIHKLWVPDNSANLWLILLAAVFVGITFLLDYVLALAGAKNSEHPDWEESGRWVVVLSDSSYHHS